MRRIFAILAISGAVTAFALGLIIVDAFQIALREAAEGNTEVIGQFIIIGVVATVAISLLRLVSQPR